MEGSIANNRLPLKEQLGFCLGHVVNDLTLAFSSGYIAVFSDITLHLGVVYVGYFILAQQLTDALLSPIVGILSDKWDGCCGISKYKSWYIFGALLELSTFTVAFCVPLTETTNDPEWARFCYYVPLFALASGAFGIVNMSHQTLLARIANTPRERSKLNGWRFAMTALSFVTVYAISWIFLYIDKTTVEKERLTANDTPAFRKAAAVLSGIGLVTTIIFQVTVTEKQKDLSVDAIYDEQSQSQNNVRTLNATFSLQDSSSAFFTDSSGTLEYNVLRNNTQDERQENEGSTKNEAPVTDIAKNDSKTNGMFDIIKDFEFFKNLIVYIGSRLTMMISSTYMPLYVTETLEMDKVAVAVVPFLVYAAGFVASILAIKANDLIGRNFTMLVGQVVVLGTCIWIAFVSTSSYKQIYGTSILFGAGLYIVHTTVMTMVTDFIKQKQEHGATSFGIFRFLLRILQGLLFVLMQNINPCKSGESSEECSRFYLYAFVLPPGCATLLPFLTIISSEVYKRRSNTATNK